MSDSDPDPMSVSAPPTVSRPQLLLPSGRWARGSWYFRDDKLKHLEVLLDEAFRVPFTQVRFGIDGIVGLVPGLGDVLAGLLSLVIPFAAWARGVPYITIVRMTANVAIGILVGSIPIFGDIFDVGWKSNRRNYLLMQRHLLAPRRHTWRDWIFLLLIVLGMLLVIAIPLALVVWFITWLLHQ